MQRGHGRIHEFAGDSLSPQGCRFAFGCIDLRPACVRDWVLVVDLFRIVADVATTPGRLGCSSGEDF